MQGGTLEELQTHLKARQQAEDALAVSEEKYRQLFEDAVEGLYNTTAEGRFLSANPAMARILGYDSPGEMLEQVTDVSKQVYVTAFSRDLLIQRLVSEGFVRGFLTQLFRSGGAKIWVSISARAVFNDQGALGQIQGFVEDVTERVEADRERNELIEQLDKQKSELERFTYTVSHDLKSPLLTIKGFLGFIEKDAGESNHDRLRGDVDRIRTAADKMHRLLEELLELSRIGRMINPSQIVEMNRLVEEALAKRREQQDEAGNGSLEGVEIVVEPDLGRVYGDHVRLRAVVENLVSNAAKFMGAQKDPRVDIGLRRDASGSVYFVRDNGIGIEPRYHQKVFGLFSQLVPESEGTGAGLAIVKRIVDFTGGRVWVESEGPGQGSTFCFTLPEKGDDATTRS
jgi:PAS domain S-box-containing protein